MPGFHGLTIDEPTGPRWDLALSLIESGEAPVRLGMLQLWRTTTGPRPDGLIHMTVEVDEAMTEEAARELLRRARDMGPRHTPRRETPRRETPRPAGGSPAVTAGPHDQSRRMASRVAQL